MRLMKTPHLALCTSCLVYCAYTYLCRAIASVLIFIVVLYVHDSKYTFMLCYIILCSTNLSYYIKHIHHEVSLGLIMHAVYRMQCTLHIVCYKSLVHWFVFVEIRSINLLFATDQFICVIKCT